MELIFAIDLKVKIFPNCRQAFRFETYRTKEQQLCLQLGAQIIIFLNKNCTP